MMTINVFKKAKLSNEAAVPIHELEMAKNRLLLGIAAWIASYFLGAENFILLAFACYQTVNMTLYLAVRAKKLSKETYWLL